MTLSSYLTQSHLSTSLVILKIIPQSILSFHTFRYMLTQSLSCVRLFCNPMDYSPLGSSVHGISQARILEWVATSFSRGPSQPRDQTQVSCISHIGRQILYHCATWEACSILQIPKPMNIHRHLKSHSFFQAEGSLNLPTRSKLKPIFTALIS